MNAQCSIRFSGHDLARTRVKPTTGRVAETMFALELLAKRGGGDLYKRWRTDVRGRLAQFDLPVSAFGVAHSYPDHRMLTGDDTWLDTASRNAAEPERGGTQFLVSVFYRIALAPYWRQVCGYLRSERETRGRVVLTGGMNLLFSTLHPLVRWEPPFLRLPGDADREIDLRGRGLLLVPSLFLVERPLLLPGKEAGQIPVLAYPAPPIPSTVETLWNAGEDNPALSALVGTTRAAMLRILVDTCSSPELARRLGISSAAVSQHTSVLREAGLIASCRKANRISHTITPLGGMVLKGNTLLAQEVS